MKHVYTLFKACEITDPATQTVGTTDDECTPWGTMKIQIDDINDNGPKFNQDRYEYYIYEDAQNGRILDNPAITIFDNDTVGGVMYAFLPFCSCTLFSYCCCVSSF